MGKPVAQRLMVWTQLLGFCREDPDRGVERYLRRIGYAPRAFLLLTYHPDFVNLYPGMEQETVLPADVCGYRGGAQDFPGRPWTNFEVRDLVRHLHARGIRCYFTVMGDYTENRYHREWMCDHPELSIYTEEKEIFFFPLKRLSDGTYYEDFFASRLAETLQGYEMDGVHLADKFCPLPMTIQEGDYSSDFFRQFLERRLCPCPDALLQDADSDALQARSARAQWLREEAFPHWARFHCTRWEELIRKVCTAVHSIGKEVFLIGMYLSDPFSSVYYLGFDPRCALRTGVDGLTPNLLPTGLFMARPYWPFVFHRLMTLAMMQAAVTEGIPKYGMLGIKDIAEEWDTLHTVPCKLERDLYTMPSYRLNTARPCIENLLLTMGDGISTEEWGWVADRMQAAFDTEGAVPCTPEVYWSESGFDASLEDYLVTRRWTTHKLVYELEDRGLYLGGVVTRRGLEGHRGTLLVPNFDLMCEAEQQEILSYDGGAVLLTVPDGYVHPALQGTPTFFDPHSKLPMRAYLLGGGNTAVIQPMEDDGLPEPTLREMRNIMYEEIPFAKVSEGFLRECVRILKMLTLPAGIGSINVPYQAFRMPDGALRLYLYNRYEDRYDFAMVETAREIRTAAKVSASPLGILHYTNRAVESSLDAAFAHAVTEEAHFGFSLKLCPGGVSIVDVYFV